MSMELLLNIIVICLLVPTIVFAVVLNKRLEILRNSRADLGRLIEAFNDATTRAEAGIPKLKQAADSAGNLLREQIQKAQILRDDMAFMIERADAVSKRLENASDAAPKASVPADDVSRRFSEDVAGRFSEDVSAASTSRQKARKRKVLAENPEDLISSAVSAAQEILRDTDKNSVENDKKFPSSAGEDFGSDRSEAERELLKALQSMR